MVLVSPDLRTESFVFAFLMTHHKATDATLQIMHVSLCAYTHTPSHSCTYYVHICVGVGVCVVTFSPFHQCLQFACS